MVALNPAYAPRESTNAVKNRVGDFFCESVDRAGSNRLSVHCPRLENEVTVTITASGLPYFLNADPIGFAGGLNWYQYAAGNPISYVDPSGLYPGEFLVDYWAGAIVNPANGTLGGSIVSAIEGTGEGFMAFNDGVVPFFDPLAAVGGYDSNDRALQTSQFIGSGTRDIVTFLGGGALGSVARAEGVATTIGQRALMAEFGPSWIGLVTSQGITKSSLVIDYTLKTAGRVSTGLDFLDLFDNSNSNEPNK